MFSNVFDRFLDFLLCKGFKHARADQFFMAGLYKWLAFLYLMCLFFLFLTAVLYLALFLIYPVLEMVVVVIFNWLDV